MLCSEAADNVVVGTDAYDAAMSGARYVVKIVPKMMPLTLRPGPGTTRKLNLREPLKT